MKFQRFLHAFQVSEGNTHQNQIPSLTGIMADTEIQQLVRDIILQLISNVVNTLEITDNSNEIGNKRHSLSLWFSLHSKFRGVKT